RIDGRAVAMQVGIEWQARLWLLKIAYDEGYARCSPGLLLLEDSLRHAARQGLLSCEFLGDARPWTRRRTRDERRTLSIRVYPRSLAGMALLARDFPRMAARHVRDTLKSRRPEA